MKKLVIFALLCIAFSPALYSHCQMPCGIYHDDMVFDQIDQYVETMFKGITVINDSKFSTTQERNETIRWIMTKDRLSDQTAELFLTYFLMQKIKPGEKDTVKRLTLAHELLFLIVKIKQNVNRDIVEQFADKWEDFKLLFHIEGYECQIEMLKKRKKEAKLKAKAEEEGKVKEATQDHDHDHEHDHPHTH